MTNSQNRSRIPGFYNLPIDQRTKELVRRGGLTKEDIDTLMGKEVFGLVSLCVREEDAHKINGEMDLEELLCVVDAVVDLNVTERLVKKVKSLVGTFQLIKTDALPTTHTK